jgi:regulator of protease activity HflC (stomatin/prohibitin superfamily)
MNTSNPRRLIGVAALLALVYLVGYVGFWQWGVCRVEVPAGKSLRLRYKGPFPFALRAVPQAQEGELVPSRDGKPAMIGILEAMPGPGRHFYSPLEYERTFVDDIVIEPGKIGVVTSKVGKPLPAGAILADTPGYRGTWRRVLTPGRYRMNDYAYQVEIVPVSRCVGTSVGVLRRENDPTLIPPGYVGVVTNKADNPITKETQGIQDRVLQPGVYFLNPYEKQVDIVSVGYNETSLTVETADASGKVGDRVGIDSTLGGEDPQYVSGKGIEFPSNDGFPIHIDYTAIWGILPDQAPDVVRQFGALTDVEDRVILPQIGSICRLYGSKRGAVDLLVGDKREEFQTDTAEELERVLSTKNLTLLFGLTRHIYVPSKVREPIQKKYIADELKLTADQSQLTAKAAADLAEAKAKISLEERRTKAETTKMVAQVAADGEKSAREIDAETERLQAEIDAKTALIEAEITTTMAEAEAKKTELSNEAEAERFAQYVQVLGGPEAYNRYIFAEKLPSDLKLGLFYAGPGTFWTDLKGFEQTMLGKIASESVKPPATSEGR